MRGKADCSSAAGGKSVERKEECLHACTQRNRVAVVSVCPRISASEGNMEAHAANKRDWAESAAKRTGLVEEIATAPPVIGLVLWSRPVP